MRDPFFAHMPRFFGMTFQELLAAKHPTAWLDFERGLIDEAAFLETFFADGRAFDGPGLADHMAAHYAYVDGMPELLRRLAAGGHALHAMSNYPSWWRRVEAGLRVRETCRLEWTFVSCEGAMKVRGLPLVRFVRACFECACACLCVRVCLGQPLCSLCFLCVCLCVAAKKESHKTLLLLPLARVMNVTTL